MYDNRPGKSVTWKGVREVFLAVLFCLTLMVPCAFANDLELTNGSFMSQDAASGTITVQFDVSWANSWRDETNHDAVWVFLKYSTDSGQTWEHATLSTSGTDPGGYSSGTGADLEILVPPDRKGCFIRRAWTGSGDVTSEGVQVVWGYASDGIGAGDINDLDIKIIGIEMVYIPQGSFYAGDFEYSTAALDQGSIFSEKDPWYVQGEDAISVTDITSNGYYYNSAGNPGEDATGAEFIIPDSFPKGYAAFYVMKYEITEEQWVDFFNTLEDAQASARDITGAGGKNSDSTVNRNTVSWDGGDAATLRPDRACGYLSWPDLAAYADWAALRPFTELEFEKASRGPDVLPNDGEYAWGNTNITPATTLSVTENGTETVTNSGANCCYGDNDLTGGDGGKGPLRAGIFAGASSSRQTAGAGYFGNMELSGNLWERCVTLGNDAGRSFRGTHGDGALTSAGNASNSDWPGYTEGQGVTAAEGTGSRGGSWEETAVGKMSISDRSEAAMADPSRSADHGGRCVRIAP